MFDDLKIRNKLILLVAGPLAIIVLLAALGARSRLATADESGRVERLVQVSQANSNVVDALQTEALYSTAFVASGREAWKTELDTARKATDAAMGTAVGRLQSVQGTSAGFRAASALAIDGADKLEYIRVTVDGGYRWDQVASVYAATETTFLAVNDTVSEAIADPQVASQLRTASALATYKVAIARQSTLVVGAAARGGFADQATFDLLTAAIDDEASGRSIFNSLADAGRKGEVRDALISPESISLDVAVDQAVAAGPGGDLTADPEALAAATATVLADLHEVETDLFVQVIGQSQASSTEAERAANFFLIGAVVAIAAAALAAIVLGRRITRPLNKLTDAADRLATEQMPKLVESLRNPSDDELAFQLGALEAIEVSSNDEIGQLASSFNDVQRVAGEVAAEQAALLRKGIGEMFVNLARRNQTLLDRQIEFIDELERGEEDPDQLENLYRLDHLATRMRRNAESLLVLAGAEPPRRRGRPAPLANVVRAALAEVEDFNRIELLSFDEVLVASNVAADLAHLLSELMENATNFSPPETRVEVVGHRTKADGYVISVSDHGIGMSNTQILEANESLAKPPLVGLALSRSLGFIVVGRLSGRHGIAVRMMPSPAGGVTAVVSIPPALVTDAPSLHRNDPPIKAAPDAPSLPETASGPAGASSLPPLTFTPIDAPAPTPVGASAAEALPAPASLADAVPTGAAFDAGLKALVDGPPESAAPSGPIASPSNGNGSNGLPTRRLSATPGPTATPPPTPAPAADPAPGAGAGEAMPEPIAFDQGPIGAGSGPGARLDGPPPSAPSLPSRAPGGRPNPDPAPSDPSSRPFFLEDAEPPRLFGRGDEPVAPPASTPPRLFGAPSAPPAAPATNGSGATPPMPTRRPKVEAGAPPAPGAPLDGRPPRIAPPSAPATPSTSEPAANAAPAAAPSAPTVETARTSTGLAKRVPRQAGAVRAIPGSDAERGVSATRRSPDEVRNLLSRYRDGTQRARVEESVSAGPSDERDTP